MKEKPYLDNEGVEVDFEAKRLKFWLETVPEDIRRLEYELWRRKRILHHANLFRFRHKEKFGRFTIKPPYTETQEKIDWEEFARSFLMGNERKERFQEIVQTVEQDIPRFLELYKDQIPLDRVLLIALSGSSVYGPRRRDEYLSDLDIGFLLDSPQSELNFEIKHERAIADLGKPYQLLGTGYTDAARGDLDIHWLIHPHYPLQNTIDDSRLKALISGIVGETRNRHAELEEEIADLEGAIQARRQEEIID